MNRSSCFVFCFQLLIFTFLVGDTRAGDMHNPVLLFMDRSDLFHVQGRIALTSQPIKEIKGYKAPDGRILGVFQGKNDQYIVFADERDREGNQFIYRTTTKNFKEYNDSLVVLELVPRPKETEWLSAKTLTRQPETGEFLLLCWSRSKPGHGAHFFKSSDGINWIHTNHNEPNYTDHDAGGLVWSEPSKKYVMLQATYQWYAKMYPDNIGDHRRRVLSIRTSGDGITWEPSVNVGFNGPYRFLQDVIMPDEKDSKEIEFYWLAAFPYADRYLGTMLIYAPSPQIVNPYQYPQPGFREGAEPSKHGPQLMNEWWICNDPAKLDSWKRPYRHDSATPQGVGPLHEPVIFNNKMIWLKRKKVYGLPAWRIAGVYSQANSAFTSKVIKVPETPLSLNADISWSGEKTGAMQRQAYVMVELLNAEGKIIEGFEKENCILNDANDLRLPLLWKNKDTSHLKGRFVSFRFYFRDATIYAILNKSEDMSLDHE